MNYLRGAVSAISAPYQYYRDLPPINPSTLTGAIDVIVVRKVHDDGQVELCCSPFHVRFGKWQVLRPGDKKVNVLVNGRTIPFNMKIGDAGEAFFVLETDAEVPDDLLTSPVLEATRPGAKVEHASDVPAGRFGAKDTAEDAAQEPEYFELDAPASDNTATTPGVVTPTATRSQHSFSQAAASTSTVASTLANVFDAVRPVNIAGAAKAVAHAVVETEQEEMDRLRDRMEAAAHVATHLREPDPFSSMKDEMLPNMDMDGKEPEVVYRNDIVIDLAGYHGRGASDSTITQDDSASEASTPGSEPSPDLPRTPDTEGDPEDSPRYNPALRATSEPPPDLELDLEKGVERAYAPSRRKPRRPSGGSTHTITGPKKSRSGLALAVPSAPTAGQTDAEYTWEWGAFPTPSPRVESFAAGSARRRIAPRPGPGLLPGWQRAQTQVDVHVDEASPREGREDTPLVPAARLVRDKTNPLRMGAAAGGRTLWMEMSIVPASQEALNGIGSDENPLSGLDAVETAELFSHGAISFERVLNDSSLLSDPRLVLRLADDRYITRADNSPLFEMLPAWRSAAQAARPATRRALSVLPEGPRIPGLPVQFPEEPLSSGDEGAPPPVKPRARKTSSWARWWGRGVPSGEDVEQGLSGGSGAVTPEPRSTASSPRLFPTSLSSGPPSPSPPLTPEPSVGQPATKSDRKFVKTLRLTSDQLKALELKLGSNSITFSLSASGAAACTARIFVWDATDSIVISDIDGTITKSDALGHVFTMIGRDWTHLGVAKLYTDICRNGYKIMYLTSRAIGQADSTREYLRGINQSSYTLPEGPVIMSPDRLMTSLHREVIMRKPEVFKMACLRDIGRLFGEAGNPFYAGFGNRITDALSYRSVDVPSSRIFTIDSTGDVKMELLELAGYKSSYIHMTDLVDQMFPPIHRRWASEYTDAAYWRPPLDAFGFDLPDLAPPSPALSARSDVSTLARLRSGFSLGGGGRHRRTESEAPTPPRTRGGSRDRDRLDKPATPLRQMSSFERLGQTLRITAQTPFAEGADAEERADWRTTRAKNHTMRARSVDSMPGSLPGSEDETVWEDDEDEDGARFEGAGDAGELADEDEGAEHDPALDADEAFDEDLLAAGEMADVPFL